MEICEIIAVITHRIIDVANIVLQCLQFKLTLKSTLCIQMLVQTDLTFSIAIKLNTGN